jgi:hypothetical protein
MKRETRNRLDGHRRRRCHDSRTPSARVALGGVAAACAFQRAAQISAIRGPGTRRRRPSDAKEKAFSRSRSPFAGEQKRLRRARLDGVEAVRRAAAGASIFYHKRFRGRAQSEFDLDQPISRSSTAKQSELLVVFLSADYAKKRVERAWSGRVMRDIIKRKDRRFGDAESGFDGTEIAGLFSIDGYVSAIGRAGGRRRDPRSLESNRASAAV